MCLLQNFNSSIWHAFAITAILSIVIYVVTYNSLDGDFYFFDPRHNPDERLSDAGDFEPHSKRYQDLARLLITLSLGAIAFLINTLSKADAPHTSFISKIEAVTPIVVGFFGSSIVLFISFLFMQALYYEDYCHSAEHNTYRRWKYALCLAAASSATISFALGLAWLAINLFGR
jgi:hypothetical protein